METCFQTEDVSRATVKEGLPEYFQNGALQNCSDNLQQEVAERRKVLKEQATHVSSFLINMNVNADVGSLCARHDKSLCSC